jgi:hypothetical protein
MKPSDGINDNGPDGQQICGTDGVLPTANSVAVKSEQQRDLERQKNPS